MIPVTEVVHITQGTGELAELNAAREQIKIAVLTAVLADTGAFHDSYAAWREVDVAAIRLARQRRAYERRIREICRRAKVNPEES